MAACDILDLCLRVKRDEKDPKVIVIWEAEDPDNEVRTSEENWLAFVAEVKNNGWDNI